MKKLIVLVMCAIMMLSVCACGTNNNQNGPTVHSNPQVLTEAGMYPILKEEYRDEITLKVMAANNAAINPDWSKNKFFIRMEELTSVKFDFEVYGDDMYQEKKGLALATGNNLPDVFIKANFNNYDEVTYGGKTLRGLNDLIDNYAPNIKKLLDDNPVIRKLITTTDGEIYSLPTMYTNLPEGIEYNMRGFLWINEQWMTELGFSMPTTPEEFLNVMRAFKREKCTIANSYPLVIAGMAELYYLFNFFGLDLTQYWVQGQEDGKLLFGPKTDEFKRALAFIKTMVDEGLMNPNWSSMTPTDVSATGSSGDYYGCFVSAAPQYVVGFGKMYQYTTLDPISESGENGFWGALYPVQRGCFSITTACKYPELAIRWIDTIYDTTKPYGLWAIIGAENEEWKWMDEDHTQWKSTVSDQEYATVMATTIIQTGDGMPYAVDEGFWAKQKTETDLYTRPLRDKQMRSGKALFPYVYFNSTELREISDLAADINSYITRYIANVISGEKNLDADWNTFTEFRRLNLDRYLEILQGRYDAFME